MSEEGVIRYEDTDGKRRAIWSPDGEQIYEGKLIPNFLGDGKPANSGGVWDHGISKLTKESTEKLRIVGEAQEPPLQPEQIIEGIKGKRHFFW